MNPLYAIILSRCCMGLRWCNHAVVIAVSKHATTVADSSMKKQVFGRDLTIL